MVESAWEKACAMRCELPQGARRALWGLRACSQPVASAPGSGVGGNDDREAVLLAEGHGVLQRGRQHVQAEALDRAATVLGLEPAEALDPHARAVRDQRRVDGDDARRR